MAKKKRKKGKGILYYIAAFFRLIFNAVKWVLLKIWAFLKWIFGLLRKGNEKRKKMAVESKRPKSESTFQSFEEVEAVEGELGVFESRLYSRKSLIGLILGARGTGKSAIGMRMLENFHSKTKRKVYCMGFGRKDLPRWITPVDSLDQIRNNAFILVDEGGIEFSSRSSMSSANKLLSDLLLISRHKDLSVLFISQNSSNIEVNTLRQSDYLLLKPPSLLQLDFERKKIKEIYEAVKDKFRKYKSERSITYIYSDQYLGFVSNGLPSFWSESVSKSYRSRK